MTYLFLYNSDGLIYELPIPVVFWLLLLYRRRMGLLLQGHPWVWIDNYKVAPSMPTLQVFYITLTATTLWSSLCMISTTPLALHWGSHPSDFLNHLPRFHHAAFLEQFCPAVFFIMTLNFTETNYDKLILKGKGSMRETQICKEDQAFPTCCPSTGGIAAVFYVEWLCG